MEISKRRRRISTLNASTSFLKLLKNTEEHAATTPNSVSVKNTEIGLGFPDTVPLARIESKMILPLGVFLAQGQISEGRGNDVGAIVALTSSKED
jgi:hypothetical protein